MIFALITFIISISLTHNFFKIRKLTKHDKCLFNFYQLQREIMSYLRNNCDFISKRDYLAAKQILSVLSAAVNFYEKDKISSPFNLPKFAKYVKETKYLSDSSQKLIKCDNNYIKGFADKLNRNIIAGFCSFTPFILAKIILKLLYFIGLFFAKAKRFKLRKWGYKFLVLNKEFTSINSYKKQLMIN